MGQISIKIFSHVNKRKAHCNRPHPIDGEKFINIVEIFNQPKKEKPNKVLRSTLSSKLSSLKAQLGKLERDLIELNKNKTMHEQNGDIHNKKKYLNKIKRKMKTIKNKKSAISSLQKERDAIPKQYNPHNKNNFIELTLNITRSNSLIKKAGIGEEYLDIVKRFISTRFNFDMHSISVHLDQGPLHVHVLAEYKDGESMYTDLDRLYEVPYQMSDMQQDWNSFLRNEIEFLNKHKIDLEYITRGSKQKYIDNLYLYKEKDKLTKENDELINSINKRTNTCFNLEKRVHSILDKIKMHTDVLDDLNYPLDDDINYAQLYDSCRTKDNKINREEVIKIFKNLYKDNLELLKRSNVFEGSVKHRDEIIEYMNKQDTRQVINELQHEVELLRMKVDEYQQDAIKNKKLNEKDVKRVLDRAETDINNLNYTINIYKNKEENLVSFLKLHNLYDEYENEYNNNLNR